MANKFIIIDDNVAFRGKIKRLIQSDWADTAVDEYSSKEQGLPGEDFDWSQYNLLLMDDLLNGQWLDWFSQYKQKPDFPGTIIFSSHHSTDDAVRAVKAGADNYLPKSALTRKRLNTAIEEILSRSKTHKLKQQNQDVKPGPKVTAEDVLEQQQPSEEHGSTPPAKTVLKRGNNSSKPPSLQLKSQKLAGDDRANWPDIKGHRLIEKIGRGGMSVIYLAERDKDGSQVVVKTLSMNLTDNRKTLLRSNQEFKLISRISNPNIVKLYEHGTIGDAMYTTMELFKGGDLKQRLRKGITQQQALQYLLQIASGLAAIHGCGIIHRDLKPGNIMFRDDDTLAIIDFGISKDINTELDLTDPGQVMGTPNYMAPEQGNGGFRPDARSDIYSVGVMLYEMITGKKPYSAPTGPAIIYKHLHDPIPTLPNQFFEMQDLLNIMMAKFPQDRFQSALDMIEYINKEFRWDITLDFV